MTYLDHWYAALTCQGTQDQSRFWGHLWLLGRSNLHHHNHNVSCCTPCYTLHPVFSSCNRVLVLGSPLHHALFLGGHTQGHTADSQSFQFDNCWVWTAAGNWSFSRCARSDPGWCCTGERPWSEPGAGAWSGPQIQWDFHHCHWRGWQCGNECACEYEAASCCCRKRLCQRYRMVWGHREGVRRGRPLPVQGQVWWWCLDGGQLCLESIGLPPQSE